ncbi:MAG TPA: hypothetical protein VFE05_05645 [Longimicrobiaceae bacterium]|jgi:hypothetical protein|nr:hypothetical protein [Longimicrobiaceae bacterium]
MTHDERSERDETRRALAGYRAPPPMPAGAIWAGIEDGLAKPEPGVVPLAPWTRRIRPWLAPALAASLVAFLAGAGVGYGVARRGDAGPPHDRQVVVAAPETPVLYPVTWF